MKRDYYKLLGIKVNLLNMEQLNSLVEESIGLNKKRIIANHNLNSLYIYHHNFTMRDFYSIADYVHIDGMALVFIGKMLSLPFERSHRVTYADWAWSLMSEAATKSWRIFYLGSKPGVADKGASILRNLYPNLQIATSHGYFAASSNGVANQEIISQIKSYHPHILMVGMGMPRQEEWILENIDEFEANVILPSGACMDYIAGEVSTPPRWMGKVGLEWLSRLTAEPKRLWRRYLVESWFIAAIFVQEYLVNLSSKLLRAKEEDVK
ncbi:MAG: WecB/TagA/CpsF family glycosyltransferase [Cyanobacteria bacterium J06621_8]